MNKKEKNVICKGWPKGAGLRKGGRIYDGPKIKGVVMKGPEN